MDILSHGLWGVALTRYYNIRYKKKNETLPPYQPLIGFFWGVFPDLVAFAPSMFFITAGLLTGSVEPHMFASRAPGTPPPPESFPLYSLALLIYNFSHSLVMFAFFFSLVIFIGRSLPNRFRIHRIPWEMLAWPLHILFDIPTHSARFFPTPFLWPLSDFHINGTPWATSAIWVPNVIALILVFWWTRKKLRSS